MAPSVEAKSKSAHPPQIQEIHLIKSAPPASLTGIIILPPSYRRRQGGDESSSSNSDETMLAHSSSVPDLRGEDKGLDFDESENTAHLSRRLSTSTSSLNVKFAPLPQLAPRKRKSNAPLGIASRATMMRRRRAGTPGYDMNGDPLPPTPPMWTDEEMQRHAERVMAERNGQPIPRDYADDPLLQLGRKMKSAWRKMNNKKSPSSDTEKGGDVPTVVAERVVLAPLRADNTNNTAATEEEGGVWEEEVSNQFPLNVGQTDTVAEGQYPWLAQLAGLSNSPVDEKSDPSQRPGTLYMTMPDEDEEENESTVPSQETSTTSSSRTSSISDSPPPTAVPRSS
ncbi:hypothetical protein MIND_01100500 [Mycena indigotica]|uniref:Uncharacterized protein n=1 Tax=Mycena indigotica TaxID=2126181 RepID=A0A8H6VVL3_9AGAR|nr:uncharacterized protein MIND_01100500 [Mycena indigotica]KAF7295604.1 hypothetical protein MIND_01100500 [Mycena indigotica]